MKGKFKYSLINRLFLITNIIGLCIFTDTVAQQKDAVLWSSVSVEKKITRHFSITVLNQYIFNQNLAELGMYFFDSGLSYRYNNHLSFSINYRFVNARNRDNFYENRQQWYADMSYVKGFGKFSATFRTRYQVQYYGLSTVENYKIPSVYSRNKFTIRYKINWYYSVFASEELFYNLRPVTVLRAYRTFGGLTRQSNLHHKLELFYGFQQQVNKKNKRMDFISGLTYYYKF